MAYFSKRETAEMDAVIEKLLAVRAEHGRDVLAAESEVWETHARIMESAGKRHAQRAALAVVEIKGLLERIMIKITQ